MAIPRMVHDLFSEVTRQTVRETVSAGDTLRRYLDNSVDTNRAYLAAWDAVQQAGLRATLGFQNALIVASQRVLDATLRAEPVPVSRRWEPRRLWPEATLKLTRKGARVIPGCSTPSREEARAAIAMDWANSALRFQAPFGTIPGWYSALDGDI